MNYSSNSPAIILMGPSAAGKTAISLELARKYPVEIISVTVPWFQGNGYW